MIPTEEDYKKFQARFNKRYGGNETMRVSERGGLYRLTLRQHKYQMFLYRTENRFFKFLRIFGILDDIDPRVIKIPNSFDDELYDIDGQLISEIKENDIWNKVYKELSKGD